MSATHTVASSEHLSLIPWECGVRVDDLAPWHDITIPAALALPMA